ncbi:MAG: response regulator [Anaerolineae bacterium]
MTEGSSGQSEVLSAELVHEALHSLYDAAGLSTCRLAGLVDASRHVADREQRAQALRKLLLEAIKSLQPKGRRPPSASAARACDCLTLRYVSGMDVEEVAEELSIGVRQVYRDLRWGEERLAEHLSCRTRPTQPEEGDSGDALGAEIESLAHRPQHVDIAQAVREVVTALEVLAVRLRVPLRYRGPVDGAVVTATPGVLREIAIQLVSAALQSAPEGGVEVRVLPGGRETALEVSLPRLVGMTRRDLLDAVMRIAEAQRLRYELSEGKEGGVVKVVFPTAARNPVLVIEDNPGAYALYQRYLENTEWQPVLVSQPRLAADLAASWQAQAVVLDIMMPETSGWDVLQALKLSPRTRDIPVIICSVLEDRELAAALGASSYLTKPLDRASLLLALRQVQIGHTAASDVPDRSG